MQQCRQRRTARTCRVQMRHVSYVLCRQRGIAILLFIVIILFGVDIFFRTEIRVIRTKCRKWYITVFLLFRRLFPSENKHALRYITFMVGDHKADPAASAGPGHKGPVQRSSCQVVTGVVSKCPYGVLSAGGWGKVQKAKRSGRVRNYQPVPPRCPYSQPKTCGMECYDPEAAIRYVWR